jgi:hypothetical protein
VVNDVLDAREKTHGSYDDVASMAQALKDTLRGGKNWKHLDDMQRETLEMLASKIGRILSGNPHEVDHWRDIAGYAQLIVNAYSVSECDPIRRPDDGSPALPSPAPASYAATGRATLP